MIRILLLSFYYPPDLSAGSFRSAALVEALRREVAGKVHIDVLTTMPNRYATLQSGEKRYERESGLSIRRYELPPHHGGMVDQARAFLSYARQVNSDTRSGEWDVVVATSSRLMTAALGARVAKRQRAFLYLDLRDLFTDTMGDVWGRSPFRVLLPVFRFLERRTLRAADRVNVVSPGFLPHVRHILGDGEYRTFTNGIDPEFIEPNFRRGSSSGQGEALVLYAGNLGEGQGLEKVLPEAARQVEGRFCFRIIGDGGRREILESRLRELDVCNVELLPPVARAKLLGHYREASVLFLHLNDHPAFRRVLPSKVFEYAATGKPIVAGVSGYAGAFIDREIDGSVVFEPCSVEGLVSALKTLDCTCAHYDRSRFKEKYARQAIMRDMAKDVLDLAGG